MYVFIMNIMQCKYFCICTFLWVNNSNQAFARSVYKHGIIYELVGIAHFATTKKHDHIHLLLNYFQLSQCVVQY